MYMNMYVSERLVLKVNMPNAIPGPSQIVKIENINI